MRVGSELLACVFKCAWYAYLITPPHTHTQRQKKMCVAHRTHTSNQTSAVTKYGPRDNDDGDDDDNHTNLLEKNTKENHTYTHTRTD